MVLEHPGLIDPPNPTETKDYTLLQCKSIVFGWTYELEYGEQNLYVTTACSLATLIFSHSVSFQFSGFQVFKNIPGLLNLDMKTKVVQHNPRINMSL